MWIFGTVELATIGGLCKQAHLGIFLSVNPNSRVFSIIRFSGLAKIDGDIQTQANSKLVNNGGPRSLA